MNKYLSTIRLGWLDALEYRAEFFISIIGWGIRLFIALFLWMAVAESQGGQIGHYSLSSMVQYLFIVQILSGFIFSRVAFDIADDIYRGDFSNYLVKPINYLLFRVLHEVSKNFLRTILALAIFGVFLLFIDIDIVFTWWKLYIGIVAIIGSYLLNFLMIGTLALMAFCITNATRLIFIYFGILTIFSGMILPLDLFPPVWQNVLNALPFPYIFFFPTRLLQATELTPQLISALATQWIYVGVGLLVIISTYRLGVKKFEAVGR